MIIPVSDQYRIQLDHYSWSIERWKTNQKHPDKSCWVAFAWFPRLEQAVQKLVQLELSESKVQTLLEWRDVHHAALIAVQEAIQESCLEDSWAAAKRKLQEKPDDQ